MKHNKQYTTSHFIGIKLKASPFVPLFVDLQTYLFKNDISSIIQLANIHSLHVSLYYLEKKLTPNEREMIPKTIQKISQGKINRHLSLNKLSFFKDATSDILAYLTTKEDGLLTEINESLRITYRRDDIVDNSYNFIPHITLFKVLKSHSFSRHKNDITSIINKFIDKFSNLNLYKRPCLFEVCSKFYPEIEISLPE
ncbi:hypothetical protein DRH14_04415 [Candidatus Shapirobacteria bacterium]|nr:MAG: hypothetical protein DRH14_04415 [Candidatus Shapirobacteria bacterium]